tara:strand:+ start:112 stop:453 length:342 start_codon:yes stop_codon:yes gene_type:complete
MSCDSVNYIKSNNYHNDNGFKNSQREIFTTLSKDDLNIVFNKDGLSCSDVLLNFFFSNICFNNNSNYIISYSGKKIELDAFNDPILFTNNIISIISRMEFGSLEYQDFINYKQ